MLISAVIQNAAAVATWLLKDGSRGNGFRQILASQTDWSRSRAFLMAWMVSCNSMSRPIVSRTFSFPGSSFPKSSHAFPEKRRTDTSQQKRAAPSRCNGLRLLENGVMIYAGRKASAAKIVRDAVEETFRRGVCWRRHQRTVILKKYPPLRKPLLKELWCGCLLDERRFRHLRPPWQYPARDSDCDRIRDAAKA